MVRSLWLRVSEQIDYYDDSIIESQFKSSSNQSRSLPGTVFKLKGMPGLLAAALNEAGRLGPGVFLRAK